MKGKVLLSCACVLLASCATMSPAERAQIEQNLISNRPTCLGKAQCEAMWDAARDWVVSSCAMKIQTITDSYIETYNPPAYSPNIACEITKDPRPAGGYELHMRVWCSNFLGCQPSQVDAMQDFERYVNATTQRFKQAKQSSQAD